MSPQLRVLVLSILGLFNISALAQSAQPACSQPEFNQFDFWVGEWDAVWPGNKPDELQKGHNTIRKVLGNCVVQEQFDGGNAIPLRGMSVSTYVPAAKQWKQTWVDNQGAYLDFTGEFTGGQMVLLRHAVNPKGQAIEQRMVYKNITPKAFDWSWEQSTDGGKSWTVSWPIHYTRTHQ